MGLFHRRTTKTLLDKLTKSVIFLQLHALTILRNPHGNFPSRTSSVINLGLLMKEKATQTIVILGSSRSNGNTLEAVNTVIQQKNVEIVDLKTLNISYFDYDHANDHDDFLPLAQKMVKHETIILATPVYWYLMSAIMKTFLDRWSDLITIHKEIGRKLARKNLYVIASYGGEFPLGFENSFRLTCSYLKMHYGGCYFHYRGKDPQQLQQNEHHAKGFKALISAK